MNYTIEICHLTSLGEKTINHIKRKYQKTEIEKIIPLLKELAIIIDENNDVETFDKKVSQEKQNQVSLFLSTEEEDESTLVIPLYLNIIDSNNKIEKVILIQGFSI